MDGVTGGPADPWQFKRKLLETARDNCAKQYDDYARNFAALDSKAQATATFAGAQLGVLLALLQKEGLSALLTTLGDGAWLLLIPTVMILVTVVGGSIFAMKVRLLPVPFMAKEEGETIRDLLALPAEEIVEEVAVNNLAEHLEAWQRVLARMDEIVDGKARAVFKCQWAMLAGLVGTTLVLLFVLLSLP